MKRVKSKSATIVLIVALLLVALSVLFMIGSAPLYR